MTKHKFSIRFTQEEKAILDKKAKEIGLVSLSDYIKFKLFIEPKEEKDNA